MGDYGIEAMDVYFANVGREARNGFEFSLWNSWGDGGLACYTWLSQSEHCGKFFAEPDSLEKAKLLLELCIQPMVSWWYHTLGPQMSLSEVERRKGRKIEFENVHYFLGLSSESSIVFTKVPPESTAPRLPNGEFDMTWHTVVEQWPHYEFANEAGKAQVRLANELIQGTVIEAEKHGLKYPKRVLSLLGRCIPRFATGKITEEGFGEAAHRGGKASLDLYSSFDRELVEVLEGRRNGAYYTAVFDRRYREIIVGESLVDWDKLRFPLSGAGGALITKATRKSTHGGWIGFLEGVEVFLIIGESAKVMFDTFHKELDNSEQA